MTKTHSPLTDTQILDAFRINNSKGKNTYLVELSPDAPKGSYSWSDITAHHIYADTLVEAERIAREYGIRFLGGKVLTHSGRPFGY